MNYTNIFECPLIARQRAVISICILCLCHKDNFCPRGLEWWTEIDKSSINIKDSVGVNAEKKKILHRVKGIRSPIHEFVFILVIWNMVAGENLRDMPAFELR